jgi:hypothetical protein
VHLYEVGGPIGFHRTATPLDKRDAKMQRRSIEQTDASRAPRIFLVNGLGRVIVTTPGGRQLRFHYGESSWCFDSGHATERSESSKWKGAARGGEWMTLGASLAAI